MKESQYNLNDLFNNLPSFEAPLMNYRDEPHENIDPVERSNNNW